MELDPFLALEQTAPPSTQPAATAASDSVDPVASLLGDDQHERAAPSAAAAAVIIDRSSDEVEKSAAVKEPAAADVGNSAPEPAGQGKTIYIQDMNSCVSSRDLILFLPAATNKILTNN